MRAQASAVHPRGRGDNVENELLIPGVFGSPPGRGDNVLCGVIAGPSDGSPPRARGQPRVARAARDGSRFTPAGAGTTSCVVLSLDRVTVHPRGRGDNRPAHASPQRGRGSPPRARGQLVGRLNLRVLCRFTPAGAGTTFSRSISRATLTVHPRGRGDNSMKVFPFRVWLGSPRGRGDNVLASVAVWSGFGSPPRARGQRP